MFSRLESRSAVGGRLLPVSLAAALLAALPLQRGAAASPPPALYTRSQARQGASAFEWKCASCHGHHLEGGVGPALEGPIFASAKSGFTIQQVYEFLSVEMPAYAPGSLTRAQYLDITAFLLQQNGYPAGSRALTDRIASQSTVPLLFQAAAKASPRVAKSRAPAGKPLTIPRANAP